VHRRVGKAFLDWLEDTGERVLVIALIPVLLAVAGLHTNLRAFELGGRRRALLFLGAMIVAKWGVSAFTGPAVGLSWRESNALGP
jgi:Kef-type K+ transport system membrane component KefB